MHPVAFMGRQTDFRKARDRVILRISTSSSGHTVTSIRQSIPWFLQKNSARSIPKLAVTRP
jgi:hypothetical protein